MIDAYGPLNTTGIAKAFTLNVKALGVLDHVNVLQDQPGKGDLLYVHSTAQELQRVSQNGSFGSYRDRIAYFVWESEVLSDKAKRALENYSVVWTASKFCAKAIEAAGFQCKVVPHAVSTYCFNPRPDAQFKFLTIFDSQSRIVRKNPFDVVRAFQLAFGNRRDVSLTIKAKNLSQDYVRILKNCGPTANIQMINNDLTEEEMENLYAEHDALISLHQAEGFGLTILEAMARGMKVIYTNWSAPTEFAVGYPVEYKLQPSEDDFYEGQLAAKPLLDSAVAQLREAVNDGDDIRAQAFQRSLDYSFSNLIKNIFNVYPAL